MSKGMSLEEFRKNLEGDAQKKLALAEEEITALKNSLNAKETQVRHLKGEIESQEKLEYYLFNRCRALSRETMCSFCGLHYKCSTIRRLYFDQRTEKITQAMVDGKLNELASEMLTKMCEQIVQKYEAENPEEVKVIQNAKAE